MNPSKNENTKAPTTAVTILAIEMPPVVASETPKTPPRYPPKNEPIIPTNMVPIVPKPLGFMALAIKPAIAPKTIQIKTLVRSIVKLVLLLINVNINFCFDIDNRNIFCNIYILRYKNLIFL